MSDAFLLRSKEECISSIMAKKTKRSKSKSAKSGKKDKKTNKKKSRRRKTLKSKGRDGIDIFSPAAMENLYYIAHNAAQCLQYRGFGWSGGKSKTKKKKKKKKKR